MTQPTRSLSLADVRKLADEGRADARFEYGLRLHRGEGVTQDFGAAIAQYRIAAELSYAPARRMLGLLLSHPPVASRALAERFATYANADVGHAFVAELGQSARASGASSARNDVDRAPHDGAQKAAAEAPTLENESNLVIGALPSSTQRTYRAHPSSGSTTGGSVTPLRKDCAPNR